MDKTFFYSTKIATGNTNCLNANLVLVFVFSVVFHVARKFYCSSQSHSPLQKRQRRELESFSSGHKSTEIKKAAVTFHQKTCERKANPHLPRPQSYAICLGIFESHPVKSFTRFSLDVPSSHASHLFHRRPISNKRLPHAS